MYCLRTAYIVLCDHYISTLCASPAKGVVSVMAARVQIPASPLETPGNSTFLGFCYAVVSILQIVLKSEKLPSTVYTTAYKHLFFTAYIGETFYLFHTTPPSGEYIFLTPLPIKFHTQSEQFRTCPYNNHMILSFHKRYVTERYLLHEHEIRPRPPDPRRT